MPKDPQTPVGHSKQQIIDNLPDHVRNKFFIKPDNIFYSTADDEILSGTDGEVDYFIYDFQKEAGSDTIYNYTEGEDKLILINFGRHNTLGESTTGWTPTGYEFDYHNYTDSTSGYVNLFTNHETGDPAISAWTGGVIFI